MSLVRKVKNMCEILSGIKLQLFLGKTLSSPTTICKFVV